MSGNIGISADQRKLLRTMQPPASTATQALEKAPPEYPSLQLVQFPYLPPWVAILAVPGAVLQQMKKTGLRGAAEPASPSTLSKMVRLLHQKADRAAADSAVHQTLWARRQSSPPPALPIERPLLHPRTGRRALHDLVLSPVTTYSVLPPGEANLVPQQPLTGPKETRRGWQPCTSPILAFHQTSR